MNQEVKEKWVKALRSGEYKQGFRALRRGDAFCCLGVLCDIFAKEKGLDWDADCRFMDEGGVLPTTVKKWAELSSCNPIAEKENKDQVSLEIAFTELNDRGCSFGDIADKIEQNL